jgi:RNA polymerase sigma-70 factor (ECF subfamily)
MNAPALDTCAGTLRTIAQAAAGDVSAQLLVIRRIASVVQARASRQLARNRVRFVAHDVEDLVQEIWVGLLCEEMLKLRRWDPERGLSLESFVGLLADRELARIRRKLAAQRRSGPGIGFSLRDDSLVIEASPENLFSQRVDYERVVIAVTRRLPERGRAVLTYLYDEQLSPNDVALRLGVTRQVVYNWAFEIRRIASALQSSSAP